MRYATGGDAGLAAVGYRVITTLRAARPPLPEGVQPAIWSILQVPPDARIAVPTHRASRRIHAFIGKPVVEMDEEGVLACDVHTDTSFKFGLQIGDSRGVSDVSDTYAYRGSSDAIARVRATVLNQEVQA